MTTITLNTGDKFTVLDNGTDLMFKLTFANPNGPYTKYPGSTDWGHPTEEWWEMTGTEQLAYNENVYVESGNNLIFNLIGSRPANARRAK